MSSSFWLLLYLAPLLGLTAALFAWFGWRWRGADLRQQIKEAQDTPEKEQTARDNAESGPNCLRDELRSALETARKNEDAAAKAHESARTAEIETNRLQGDLEALRTERDQAADALQAAHAELELLRAQLTNNKSSASPAPADSSPPPAKKPEQKPPTPATNSLREKITAIEALIGSHQSTVAELTQQRDDWRRKVGELEDGSPADPAALVLARRSLVESEKRLLAVTKEIERLQNQTRGLNRADTENASLASVPDDDLTRIKGIKKVINEKLRAHGIRTWRQIARWDEDELQAFDGLLGFKNRARRENWQEQARALHEAAHGPLT